MWDKLKREWKTAAVAILGVVVGTYDAAIATGYTSADFAPIIPEAWKPYAPLVFGLTMLALRKWKDVADK